METDSGHGQMNTKPVTLSLSHKEWRRIAKKERRRRLRQKAAKERDADDDRLRAALEQSAGYLNWVQKQEEQEQEREEKEAEEYAEGKKRWLEAEVKAQKEFRELQERRAKARQEQLQQEEIIRKEFEAKQKVLQEKREEIKRRQEEELKRQEELEREIDDYIDMGTQTPEPLRQVTDSQPGKELCPFFSKTAACRYGDTCSRNHRRNALSKIIIIPGFYSHFSLEKNSAEYDTDISLEFESSETRKHFREFYRDIIPELEGFGRIRTFKCCCNSEIHLRGNVYVEYSSEREAARAWRGLKGRWYASRQLNCEFANFQSWRNAVCGMAKCPKGRACNFIHAFQNPSNDYDIKSPLRRSAKSERGSSRSSHRDWRWSESPESEIINQRVHSKENTRNRTSSRHSSHSETSSHSSTRSSKHKSSSSTPKRKKRHRSRERRSKDGSSKYLDIKKANATVSGCTVGETT